MSDPIDELPKDVPLTLTGHYIIYHCQASDHDDPVSFIPHFNSMCVIADKYYVLRVNSLYILFKAHPRLCTVM